MKKLISAFAITAIATLGAFNPAHAEDDAKKDKGDWFAKCDTNGDGEITKDEFTEKMKDKGKDEAEIDKAFAKKDADGDGKITKAEADAAKKAKEKKADS